MLKLYAEVGVLDQLPRPLVGRGHWPIPDYLRGLGVCSTHTSVSSFFNNAALQWWILLIPGTMMR